MSAVIYAAGYGAYGAVVSETRVSVVFAFDKSEVFRCALLDYRVYKDNWQEIVGNCDTLLYLGGNDTETHEYISKRLGKETIRSDSYSTSKGRNGSTSKSTQLISRDLMTFDEVAKLDNNKAIVFFKGQDPLMDDKYDLKTHPNYQNRRKAPAFRYGDIRRMEVFRF